VPNLALAKLTRVVRYGAQAADLDWGPLFSASPSVAQAADGDDGDRLNGACLLPLLTPVAATAEISAPSSFCPIPCSSYLPNPTSSPLPLPRPRSTTATSLVRERPQTRNCLPYASGISPASRQITLLRMPESCSAHVRVPSWHCPCAAPLSHRQHASGRVIAGQNAWSKAVIHE
jgi:hypothetical protein